MPRKVTYEEACEIGRSLDHIWINRVTGKPMMPRAEWERLPRWRRIRDVLLIRHPLKDPDDPVLFPPARGAATD